MPEMQPVTYIADSENHIPKALRLYFESQGFTLVPYLLGQPLGTILLIFSPLWNGDLYLSVEGVWARYLAKAYPNTKMIVAGSVQSDDPNYVDLLKMPEDWPNFLAQVPTAERFKTALPVFTGGADMLERMRRFLLGHGNESMAQICGEIDINLGPGLAALNTDKDGSSVKIVVQIVNSEETKKQWNILRNRWLNYQSLFVFLPFENIFQEINDLIEQLRPLFEGLSANNDNIRDWLVRLLSLLRALQSKLEILEAYINDEI